MLNIIYKAALIAALVFVVALIGLAAWRYLSPSAQPHQEQHTSQAGQTDKENAEAKNERIFAKFIAGFVQFLRLLDRHNGIVNAFGTLVIGFFTFVLFIATVALFYSSENAVEASRKSADAAQKSAKVAEDSLTLLNRPFVFPENMRLNRDTFKESVLATQKQLIIFPKVEFELMNYGKTPALLREYVAKVEFYKGGPPVPPDYKFPIVVGQMVIGPGDKIARERLFAWQPHTNPTEEEKQKLIDLDLTFYFFGYVRYDDIFGNRHTQGFCFAFRGWTNDPPDGSRDQFLQVGGEDYNYDKQEKASETEPFWWGMRGDMERAKEKDKTTDAPPPK